MPAPLPLKETLTKLLRLSGPMIAKAWLRPADVADMESALALIGERCAEGVVRAVVLWSARGLRSAAAFRDAAGIGMLGCNSRAPPSVLYSAASTLATQSAALCWPCRATGPTPPARSAPHARKHLRRSVHRAEVDGRRVQRPPLACQQSTRGVEYPGRVSKAVMSGTSTSALDSPLWPLQRERTKMLRVSVRVGMDKAKLNELFGSDSEVTIGLVKPFWGVARRCGNAFPSRLQFGTANEFDN
eukprot:1974766-Pleurochrysis_carterae.AAC.7